MNLLIFIGICFLTVALAEQKTCKVPLYVTVKGTCHDGYCMETISGGKKPKDKIIQMCRGATPGLACSYEEDLSSHRDLSRLYRTFMCYICVAVHTEAGRYSHGLVHTDTAHVPAEDGFNDGTCRGIHCLATGKTMADKDGHVIAKECVC